MLNNILRQVAAPFAGTALREGATWSDRALIHHAQSLYDGKVNCRETAWPCCKVPF